MKQRARGAAAAAAAVVALAGCTLAPVADVPESPRIARYTATPLPEATAGGSLEGERVQHFVDAESIAPAWWTVFGSAEIDALVAQALSRSPTLQAAEAALRSAQELAAAQRGTLLPTVDFGYTANRGRTPDALASPLNSGASVYTLHTAQLSVGYVVDVFGAARSAVAAQDAQRDSQAWQLRAAQLTLAANVVAAVVQEASLREQLAATERLVALTGRQWQLLRTQQRLGEVAGTAVLAQETLLHQAEANAAALRRQLAQQRHLLAVLVGLPPGELVPPTLQLAALHLPDVPLRLPGQLLAQRPDVRVAEAQLRAASAAVGVANANLLPQLSLSANVGSSAESLAHLFGAGGLLWNVGADLAQPLFQGGALRHRQRAAEAQLEQARAQYRSTVLVAFQNVADALEAVRHDADQQVATSAQLAAAEATLRAAERQQQLGDISALTLLNAEAAALQSAAAAAQARASRQADVVAVYLALGGSWGEAAGTGTASPKDPRNPSEGR